MNQAWRELLTKGAVCVALAYGCIRLGRWLAHAPDLGVALLAGGIVALLCLAAVLPEHQERRFLVRLLLLALVMRWLTAYVLYSRGLNSSIGPDYATYDFFGNQLSLTWQGLLDTHWRASRVNAERSGWGMYYYVGAVYYFIGRNPLAIQLINCALGAATCLLVYHITLLVYPLPRVARMAALLTACAPSMVLWSAQGLKESPIVLCLCLCTFFALRLCRKFKTHDFAWLLLSLFSLYSLRHYAFYIVFIAVAGALVFTTKKFTPARILQGVTLVILLGLAFAYVGADEVAQKSFDLTRLQESRAWSAKVSKTGYGGDVDVTDSRAALSYLPVGVLYVLLAPFPWEIRNSKQLFMLPEMLVWWAALPLLLSGFWFMARRRLLPALPICIFTVGLTLAYALFLTNVGTVHRQRSQLLVFFFVFVSIGWEQWQRARRTRRVRRVNVAPPLKLPTAAHATTGFVAPQTLAARTPRVALGRR